MTMNKTIAAFGEVMMRLEVPNYELLSQANQLHYSFSGTGVNIASSLAKFGYRGLVVTSLPDNSLGDAAIAFLNKLAIDTRYVSQHGNYIGKYFLEQGFGPRASKVTYSNRIESSFHTASADHYNFEEIAQNCDLLHFCGISLAMNDNVRQHVKELASIMKQQGKMVLFDCNFRPNLWGKDGNKKAKKHYVEMLKLADITIMNEKDAMLTLGLTTKETDRRKQLEDLIPKIAKHYQISVIAGTNREILANNQHAIEGYIYKNGRMYFSDSRAFPVLDRIGAGDAYTAGIIHGEFQAYPPEKALSFAITSSVLAHTTKGDTPLATEKDILRLIEQGSTDIER